MATRTGLLLTKTVRVTARSLGKVDGNKLLSVVLEGLKNSPQFKMPFLKRILENKDSMDTLRRLVCLFAEQYSQLFLDLLGLQTTTCCHQLFQAIAR